MLHYDIQLCAGEKHPLARALVFAKGDKDSTTLHIRFFNGQTALGEEDGCSATLQVLFEGEEEASTFLLTKEEEGGYSIAMEAPLLAVAGVARCTASLYDATGARLTVGRFTYTVAEDPSLPADSSLTQAQVSLVQQALSSIALAYDQIEELQLALGEDSSYAQQMGDYAKEWGDAAKDAVEGVALTWYTLPGKPSTFPPSTHTHREFTLIQAQIPDPQRLMILQELPEGCETALEGLHSLCDAGQQAGFLWVEGLEDLPEVTGLLWFYGQSDGSFTALFSDGLHLWVRRGTQEAWLGQWSQPLFASALCQQQHTLLANSWTNTLNGYTQSLTVSGLSAAYRGSVSLPAGLSAEQRAAARRAQLSVQSVVEGGVVILADGTQPQVDIPILVQFDAV